MHGNAIEFARHAFPSAAVADMKAMGSPALSHNFSYAVAQAIGTDTGIDSRFC